MPKKILAEIHKTSLMDLPGNILFDDRCHNSTGIVGSVHSEIPFAGAVFIGLFHKPIPDSIPQYGTILMSLGDFHFTHVKPGTYYLMATSISWEMKSLDILLPHATLRTRHHEPIVVESFRDVHRRNVTLYPPEIDDPPILISLPLLMSRFLRRINPKGS